MLYGLKLFLGALLFTMPIKVHSLLPDLGSNDSIVYVWDFGVSDPSIKKIGAMLTNDFETELINSGLYTVLERRRYNRVLAHQNLESQIRGVQNLPTASVDSLKAISAGTVIFGDIKDDIDSGVYEVTVTFQSLNEIILRKGSILIGRGLIADNQTRKNAMKDLLDRLHAKELMAAKKEQYDRVSKVLSTYMVRVKDVQKEFADMALFAFDDQNYMEELGSRIRDYNEIFDDLNNYGPKYLTDFTGQWKEPRGQELDAIFSGILDDIHKTQVLKLDKVRISIGEYQRSSLSNSEKRKRREEILKEIKAITDDLKTQIDIMDLKISSFQSHIRTEMSG